MTMILNDVMPKILASSLATLRENAVMAKLVNQDYSVDFAQKGSTVNVPVPTKLYTQDVIPGPTSQNSADFQLDTVNVPLSYWKESAFALSDRELSTIMDGVPNMQITEAAKAIANAIDSSIISMYTRAYNYAGVAGTTPFATAPKEALDARKILNSRLAPMTDRRLVMNTDTESAALGLPAFQYYLNSGDRLTQSEGELGRKFGMDWYMDQNLGQHVAGTIAGTLVTAGAPVSLVTADNSDPINRNPRTTQSITISGVNAGTSVVVGDVFTVAGDSQTYVVNTPAVASGGVVTIGFNPAPLVSWATASAVTFKAARGLNLCFHRDAIALAMRPLETSTLAPSLGDASMTMTEEISGVPLRLQIRNEYNRVRFSVSALWGVALVRPEHLVVIAS